MKRTYTSPPHLVQALLAAAVIGVGLSSLASAADFAKYDNIGGRYLVYKMSKGCAAATTFTSQVTGVERDFTMRVINENMFFSLVFKNPAWELPGNDAWDASVVIDGEKFEGRFSTWDDGGNMGSFAVMSAVASLGMVKKLMIGKRLKLLNSKGQELASHRLDSSKAAIASLFKCWREVFKNTSPNPFKGGSKKLARNPFEKGA